MNYDTKSYRKAHKIPLDLAIGYRNVWADRMDSVIQMIGLGLKLKDIGEHYDCTAKNVGNAMRRAGLVSIHHVRAKTRKTEQ